MKAAIWMGAIALMLSQSASAQFASPCACGGVLVMKPGLTLSGNTICASRGSEQWSEFHEAGGRVLDYKGGTPEVVGHWTSNNISVTYDYGTGGRYTWALCRVATGAPYNFCQGTNVVSGATLKTGQTSCP